MYQLTKAIKHEDTKSENSNLVLVNDTPEPGLFRQHVMNNTGEVTLSEQTKKVIHRSAKLTELYRAEVKQCNSL